MSVGTVIATSLNIRQSPAPDGVIVGILRQGADVTVSNATDDWLQISAVVDGVTRLGWVNRNFVKLAAGTDDPVASPQPESPLAVPPVEAPAVRTPAGPVLQPESSPPVAVPPIDPAVDVPPTEGDGAAFDRSGTWALGPDRKRFASYKGTGFGTLGSTTLEAWLTTKAIPMNSELRVVKAVSANEGRFEAINSYDDAFMSVGLFQWTAGEGGADGELGALLGRLANDFPDVFQLYFAKYGLTLGTAGRDPATRPLLLDEKPLNSVEAKAPLRSVEWAYRFWRAGHDDRVRGNQVAHTAGRVDLFSAKEVRGHKIGEWVTSEYGVALLLDEHVNRPNRVQGSIEKGIDKIITDLAAVDLASWTTTDEDRLLTAYVEARVSSGMTDSFARAVRIQGSVQAGGLSEERNSYEP